VPDSELRYGKLASEGYTTQDTPHGADVVLINTETWIQDDVDDWVRVCGEENVSFGR